MRQKQTAFDKALGFITASIEQVKEITKPQKKFLQWLFEKWVMLPSRHNFLNIFRYGDGQYCERSIRDQFSRKINFFCWFQSAFSSMKGKECIAVFDPSYIRKSGNKTYGKGKFWSGKDQRTKDGLEIGCLALTDVSDGTAYSMEAVQTPSDTQGKLIEHYVGIINKRVKEILSYTSYLAADGFFMKKSFIEPLRKAGLQIITKMRPDANLRYLYTGKQKAGRGRKKIYEGKVDVKNIDKGKWNKCLDDEDITGYELKVWCVALKQVVKAVYLTSKNRQGHAILLSTDTQMEGAKIIRYYQLRFQIEFLIRDAKQHAGLEECQARSETKLYNHFNMALMTVSLMKLTCWASLEGKENIAFSMRSIKTWFYNKFLTETIFSNLGIQLNCQKTKRLYRKCLEIGQMAA